MGPLPSTARQARAQRRQDKKDADAIPNDQLEQTRNTANDCHTPKDFTQASIMSPTEQSLTLTLTNYA